MVSSDLVVDIGIPVNVTKLLSSRLLIQAGSGGGKSYAERKLMESVAGKVQQLIIDPEGEFVTLREKFNFLLVSKEGDIPISLRYAETLAHKLLKTGVSAILDLYELKKHERRIFVQRFGDALLNAPKELWHPCLIHIDEAHEFAPEGGKSESLDAVIGLCTRGRKREFCTILSTQRISKLHKDAAAECRNKLIGLSTLDIDRNRAGEELGFANKKDNLVLRDLEPGNFYGFGPAISNEIIKFKVGKVSTTHEHQRRPDIQALPAPKAIQKILSELQDIPEEAERELTTRQQLQGEVTRLRSELSKANSAVKAGAKAGGTDQRVIDMAIDRARKEVTAHYGPLIKERDKVIGELNATVKQLHGRLGKIGDLAAGAGGVAPVNRVLPSGPPVFQEQRPSGSLSPALPSSPAPKRPIELSGNGTLGRCPKAILSFLASMPDREFSKVQIAVAVSYSPSSSGFNNALYELNAKGLIVRNGRIRANSQAQSEITAAIGVVQLQDYSIETFKDKLSKCEGEIYDVLLTNPTDAFTKEQLAENTASKYSVTSSGFNNALYHLNTLELISRQNGKIQLNPELLEL